MGAWSQAALLVALVVACAAAGELRRGEDEEGDLEQLHRFKRQIGFTFGVPNFNANARPTNIPGRQDQGRPVNVGQVLGSVIGGFLNPQSQNANNNLAGALAGLNNALSPNQIPGERFKKSKLSKMDAWDHSRGGIDNRVDFSISGTKSSTNHSRHIHTSSGLRRNSNPVFISSAYASSNGSRRVIRAVRSSKESSTLRSDTSDSPSPVEGSNNCPSSWFRSSASSKKTGTSDYASYRVRKLASLHNKPAKRNTALESKKLLREIVGTLNSLGIKPDAIVGSIPSLDQNKNENVLIFPNNNENEPAELQSTRDALTRLDNSEPNVGVTLATFTVAGVPLSLVQIDGKIILIVEVTGDCNQDKGGCEQGCRQQGRFVRCFCNSGFVLNRDRKTCNDIDECQFNNGGCRQVCNNTPGSFECACQAGFTVAGDGRSCLPGGSGVFPGGGGGGGGFLGGGGVVPGAQTGGGAGGCAVNNGGCEHICRERNGRVRCRCEPGYERNADLQTCSDIDECAYDNAGCSEICMNTPGSFECGCEDPSSALQADGRTCSSVAQPVVESSCSANNGGCSQVCQQTFQGVRCFCNQGFNLLADGRTCADLNECDFRNGGCSEICTNTDGSFTCSCSPGKTLLGDGRTCVAGGCSTNNGGCEQTCNPNALAFGGTPCGCNPGYTLNNDGRTCSDVNECQANNGGCDQICTNTPGSFQCQCRPGFRFSGNSCRAAPSGEQPPPATTPPPGPSQPSTQLRSCGQNANKNINNQIRIVGGRPANPNDWPWMVALLQSSNNNQYCGGALVTDSHVLTAAHCVVQFKSGDIKVRVGEYDFQEASDNSPFDFNVADIEAHEQYDTKTQEHDIAVLRLERAVEFSDFVQPVCLPPPGTDVEGMSAFVIGWGTTAFGGPVSNVLREVQVPIWTRNDCDASYPGKVFAKMMCAGLKKGGKDSCQGDSGGPLLTQLPGSRTWYVVGVVSWGIECARADRPGVYTMVEQYLDWIDSKLQ